MAIKGEKERSLSCRRDLQSAFDAKTLVAISLSLSLSLGACVVCGSLRMTPVHFCNSTAAPWNLKFEHEPRYSTNFTKTLYSDRGVHGLGRAEPRHTQAQPKFWAGRVWLEQGWSFEALAHPFSQMGWAKSTGPGFLITFPYFYISFWQIHVQLRVKYMWAGL